MRPDSDGTKLKQNNARTTAARLSCSFGGLSVAALRGRRQCAPMLDADRVRWHGVTERHVEKCVREVKRVRYDAASSRRKMTDRFGALGRRRILLFDGRPGSREHAVVALTEFGADIAVPEGDSDTIDPSPRDLIAIVVSDPHADDHDALRIERIVTRLREVNSVPVLVLATTVDDDLLLQEFRPHIPAHRRTVAMDFAERVRSVLRGDRSEPLTFGTLMIDRRRRVVEVAGRPVDMTRKEFDLLEFLASSPNRAYSRDELLAAVWRSSRDWQSSATVTEHLRRLRAKLDAQRDDGASWLVTVRGIGYRFEP